jgi:hypothetical protein
MRTCLVICAVLVARPTLTALATPPVARQDRELPLNVWVAAEIPDVAPRLSYTWVEPMEGKLLDAWTIQVPEGQNLLEVRVRFAVDECVSVHAIGPGPHSLHSPETPWWPACNGGGAGNDGYQFTGGPRTWERLKRRGAHQLVAGIFVATGWSSCKPRRYQIMVCADKGCRDDVSWKAPLPSSRRDPESHGR